MLGGWNRVPCCFCASVVALCAHEGCDCVGAHEIHQVGSSSQSSRLHGGDPAKAKIMQFEGAASRNGPHLVAGGLELSMDRQFLIAAVRTNRHGIPDLHQESFQEIGQPEALWICVHHREKGGAGGHHHPFWDGFDGYGQLAPMSFQDVLEALLVEEAIPVKVLRAQGLCFIDLLLGDDFSQQVALDEILEPEEDHLVPTAVAASAFKVAVHVLGAWRVLLPMAELVAVGG
mmetsp:Transcript_50323/g.117410  ORF Transcript_50323/g.117410 Transcript_50323/m.117410 type:complete len:231 (-) Transcript_50323:228-920(-)